jgi:putative aminopeptidase FrvX
MSAADTQSKRQREELIPDMPKDMKERMLDLFKVQASDNEHQMVSYITKELEKRNVSYYVDNWGNILVTKGTAGYYPCVCAHMDTVHDIYETFTLKVKRRGQHEMLLAHSGSLQVGTGGDDKCGILACFEALDRFDAIKVAFFTQEEYGLIGSSNVCHTWFSDVGYVIQLDRYGRGDFICRTWWDRTVSDEFLDAIENSMLTYGYIEAEGLITDSINLYEEGIGISCVNVSCGYYQHHTKSEFVDLNELYNSILFLYDIIDDLGYKEYPKMKEKRIYGGESDYDFWHRDDPYNYYQHNNKFILRLCPIDHYTIMGAVEALGVHSVSDVVNVDEFYDMYDALREDGDKATREDVIGFINRYDEGN